jgi:hypothetical protein
MGLFSAIDQIRETAQLDSSEGASSLPHANFHCRIVRVAGIFAGIGGLLGIAVSLAAMGTIQTGREFFGLFLMPIAFGCGGFLFGMSLMCMFAPREFLEGPVGRKWMALIGTRNVFAARFVCMLFGLLCMAPIVGLGLLLAFAK